MLSRDGGEYIVSVAVASDLWRGHSTAESADMVWRERWSDV